jgi:hypothetical protein
VEEARGGEGFFSEQEEDSLDNDRGGSWCKSRALDLDQTTAGLYLQTIVFVESNSVKGSVMHCSLFIRWTLLIRESNREFPAGIAALFGDPVILRSWCISTHRLTTTWK